LTFNVGEEMKFHRSFAVVIAALVAVAGCNSPSFPYPEYEVMTGFVTVIDRDSRSYPLVLIEAQPH
jgi:hypothetical protein